MELHEKNILSEQLAENIVDALHLERRFWVRLRRHFLAGLLVLTPLGVTIWVVVWLVNLVDGKTRHFLARVLSQFGLDYSFNLFGHTYSVIPFGFGILVVFVGICFVGMVTGNVIGRWFFRIIEAIIRRVPGVSWIYNAATQMSQAFFNRKASLLESVVIVEYPRRGMFGIGFVTAKDICHPMQPNDKKVHAVFIPTTPNPTSGFLLLVPVEECLPTDMTVEEGMKAVISGGVVIPPTLKNPPSTTDPEYVV